ncbi:sensor domain-containing diguanylate cyclase/phosphohydrolase [Isachenkonia alkalipeptolytica]|uniref:PAS domain S-box protein n=1 Tax=Isachenkonia alkalipeptolytica TaxID=2565777 RepID=A0AA43XJU6_9CLOT|nr:PAS domain S-box protein [Isachenkonia alkalipeptolytica]NBG87200.1 PAS domain S-box protein [Isachenkonia alkalipeptolytica]
MNEQQNIKNIRDLQRALKKSEDLLRKVIDTIPLRVFWKDRNCRYLGCNKAFAKDSGWEEPEKLIGKTDYEMAWKFYAEDYQKDDRFVMETGEEKINFIENVVNEKGEHRYVRTSKIPLYDEKERIFGMLGTFEDITDIMEIKKALKESEKRYEELTLRSRALVFELDPKGQFTYVSPSAKALFGYEEEELLGKMFFYELAPEDQREELKAFGEEILKQGGTVSDFEHTLQTKDGRRISVMTNGFCTLNKRGEVESFQGIDVDITHIKEAEERVRYLSYHDQLTGLYNRHFIEEEMQRLDVERNLPLSMIMIDANGLKLVNDAFGHKAGDELLLKTARVVKQVTRKEDLVARTGGDEFLVFLPETGVEETLKIQKRMEDLAKEVIVCNLPLSFSVGSYTKKHTRITMEDALSQAETRMYRQKFRERETVRKKYINGILQQLFIRSPEEKRHAERIKELSRRIGVSMGIEGRKLQNLERAAYYHDIGKISIREDLLLKKGKLNKKEEQEITRHSEIGYSIFNSSTEFIPLSDTLLAHHERYDGKGYPKGLKGKEIPLWSQIIHFANLYDDLTSTRTRQEVYSCEKALEELTEAKGTAIDPEYFDQWMEVLDKRS